MQELIDSYKRGQVNLEKFASEDFILKNCLFTIWESFESSAWYELIINKDIEKAKQSFNDCGFADLEECNFSKDIFGYKRNSPIYAALSDNTYLIKQFANADYILQSCPKKGKSFKEIAKTGENHIYIDTIIKSMNKASGINWNGGTLEYWKNGF